MNFVKYFAYFLLILQSLILSLVRSHYIEEINPYDTSNYRIISPHLSILHTIPPPVLHEGEGNLNPINPPNEDSTKLFSLPSYGDSKSASDPGTAQNDDSNELPIIRSTSFLPPKISDEMLAYHSQAAKEFPQVQCLDPEENIGICQPHAMCASYYTQFLMTNKMKSAVCVMSNGENGICCQPVVVQEATAKIMQPQKLDLYVSKDAFVEEMGETLEDVADLVRLAINEDDQLESRLQLNTDNIIDRGTASHGHLQFFMTSQKALSISKSGQGLLAATNAVKLRMKIDDEMAGNGLREYSLHNSSAKDKCIVKGRCDPYYNYYRTIDGSCNNLNKSEMGMSFTPLYRILPPKYTDGLWTPPTSALGTHVELPNVRKLSTTIATDQNYPHSHNNLWVMQFGQFIDHDLSHVPIHRYQNLSGIECCKKDGRGTLSVKDRHPRCFPIEIPKDDHFYRAYRQRCMNFVRSMVGPRTDCSLGYADQLNQITSYLDSSNVYGSRSEEESELRLKKDGLLKSRNLVNYQSSQVLPTQERPGDECTHHDNETYCYNAGDLRANEMIGLSATHVVFLREHNRIATILKKMNSGWNDDVIFYEARRILNAQYQHILYNEWLPILVGRKFMKTYGILPLSEGYAKDYDPRIDATVSNAFATAAYRMGHSLIQGLMTLQDEVDSSAEEEVYLIHEHFNNPFALEKLGMHEKILRSLGTNPMQNFDPHVSNEVTNRLFQPPNKHYGLDLISLNIQRGRDHGLPSYNEFRTICQLGKAKSFDDLLHHMSAMKVNQLRKIYRSVEDIDLFVGGLCEYPLPGALLGATFTCIVGDQFARSKKADRFAYDLGGQEHSFTVAQLTEIRQASWSRMLCDTSETLKRIQPLSFYLPDEAYNPVVDCSSPLIPKVDLTFWRHY